MGLELGKVAILFAFVFIHSGWGTNLLNPHGGRICNFYTPEECDSDSPAARCSLGSQCDPVADQKSYCYIKWLNTSTSLASGDTLNGSSVKVLRKGCWGQDIGCEGKNECVEDRENPGEFFCCCSDDYCNRSPQYRPSKQNTDTPDDPGGGKNSLLCEFYDPNCGGDEKDCNKTVTLCEVPEDTKASHCYATWKNNSGVTEIQMKGCWLNHRDCYRDSCVETSADGEYLFCCCSGDMCNSDFEHRPIEDISAPSDEVVAEKDNPLKETLLYSIVPIVAFAIIVVLIFTVWRRHHMHQHEQLPTMDPSPVPAVPPSPILGLQPLQLLEVRARGRFGCVWKARMVDQDVAVKVFPLQDRQSWLAEWEVYNLPGMTMHDNVLCFIGAEKRGDGGVNTDLWLITEYHERGSLYDYLKGNLLSWAELVKIAESMACGLAFLHEEKPATEHMACKPAVAHRDFKSRNVLLKHDLTACIADFGLALVFEPLRAIGDTHGQVGTRRYMAPEVLEGAINFSRDSFLRIDMYALGLVLWELMSRCSAVDGPVDDYQLPFEEEVGQHPTLEDIQDVVVQKKQRPLCKEHWLNHYGMASMWHTVDECWDHDPDARLSAGCVGERVSQLHSGSSSSPAPLSVVVMPNQQTPPKESCI